MHIVWQTGTTVSEEPSTSTCMLMAADSSEMSVPYVPTIRIRSNIRNSDLASNNHFMVSDR